MCTTWEKILLKDNKDYINRVINPDSKELNSLDKIMFYYDNDFECNYPKDLEKRDTAYLVYSLLGWDSHSVANFMPCPNSTFNQAKGTAKVKLPLGTDALNITNDYLPLMIDLIQKSMIFREKETQVQIDYKLNGSNYSNKLIVTYFGYDANTKASKEQPILYSMIEEWKNWFQNEENRALYCLDEYYYIIKENNMKKIVGIPLFRGQSLSYPIPKTEKEVKECIENIVSRTHNRALKLAERLKGTTSL